MAIIVVRLTNKYSKKQINYLILSYLMRLVPDFPLCISFFNSATIARPHQLFSAPIVLLFFFNNFDALILSKV